MFILLIQYLIRTRAIVNLSLCTWGNQNCHNLPQTTSLSLDLYCFKGCKHHLLRGIQSFPNLFSIWLLGSHTKLELTYESTTAFSKPIVSLHSLGNTSQIPHDAKRQMALGPEWTVGYFTVKFTRPDHEQKVFISVSKDTGICIKPQQYSPF